MESTAFVLLEGVLQAAEVLDLLSWCQTGNLGITRYYLFSKYDLHLVNGGKCLSTAFAFINTWKLKTTILP